MENVLRWYEKAAKLKELKRAGWERCGVQPCETVADHSLGVALLALAAGASTKLNFERCCALAVVHDLAEAVVGDITPNDSITPQEKHEREADAIRQLEETLGGARISELWHEFEAGETAEAKLVRELDVIEMAWQARKYQRGGALDISKAAQFEESALQRVKSPAGVHLLKEIMGEEE
jgi:putative hydrolases of HD superfamily